MMDVPVRMYGAAGVKGAKGKKGKRKQQKQGFLAWRAGLGCDLSPNRYAFEDHSRDNRDKSSRGAIGLGNEKDKL